MRGGSHPEGAEGATWVPALSGGVKLVLKQHWTEGGKWAAVQGGRKGKGDQGGGREDILRLCRKILKRTRQRSLLL